jgi:hypothetical protein
MSTKRYHSFSGRISDLSSTRVHASGLHSCTTVHRRCISPPSIQQHAIDAQNSNPLCGHMKRGQMAGWTHNVKLHRLHRARLFFLSRPPVGRFAGMPGTRDMADTPYTVRRSFGADTSVACVAALLTTFPVWTGNRYQSSRLEHERRLCSSVPAASGQRLRQPHGTTSKQI